MADKPKYVAVSMTDRGLPRFEVSGGPFARHQQMGWHVTRADSGLTVAVACDRGFLERLNALEVLFADLCNVGALYQLGKLEEDGYLVHATDADPDVMRRIREQWRKLTASEKPGVPTVG